MASPSAGRSAVQVVCRLKPTDPARYGDDVRLDLKENIIEVKHKKKADYSAGVVDNTPEFHRFVLNNVLFNASQAQMFESCCKDIVDGALTGISGALLAYGQTGAGKTYTMVGPAGKYAERGIVPRTISYVFEAAERARMEGGEDKFKLRISYLEIYQDRLIDLLATSPDFSGTEAADSGSTKPASGDTSVPTPLAIIEDSKGKVTVKGLCCPLVRTEADAFNWFFSGEANRAIAEHALNKASTRSHCVFSIYIEQSMILERATGRLRVPTKTDVVPPDADGKTPDSKGAKESGVTVVSKLHLVDLAGSERLEKSESEGVMRKEAQAINKSLSFLEHVRVIDQAAVYCHARHLYAESYIMCAIWMLLQVVVAITEKDRDHVPYRSSKLTHFLKESFTHGKTRLIAAVWPDSSFMDETMSTLRFAMRMMHIKTLQQREILSGGLSEAERNRIVATYEREIALLRTELAFQDALAGRTSSGYTPLSPEEDAIMQLRVQKMVEDDREEFSFSSIREAHALIAAFRDLARSFKSAPLQALLSQTHHTAASNGGDLKVASPKAGSSASSEHVADAAAESDDVASDRPSVTDESARNAELGRWRTEGGQGFGLYHEYLLSKQSVKEKKADYAALAAKLNESKRSIDVLIAKSNEVVGRPTDTLDGLKTAKNAYRKLFEEMNDMKAELEYVQGVSEQLAQRIAKEFQRHWIRTCGPSPSKVRSPSRMADSVVGAGVAALTSPSAGVASPTAVVSSEMAFQAARSKVVPKPKVQSWTN
jgi:kinesin family protein 6/9